MNAWPWPRGARPLRYPEEIDELQALVAECHPGRDPRPDLHYFAHPTIVVADDEGLVGYSVMSMQVASSELALPVASVMCMDTGVHPRGRGAGLGRLLLQLRYAIGRACGAVVAIGTVRPDNRAMAAIHREVGMEPKGAVMRGHFTDLDPPADAQLMIAPPEALEAADEAVSEAEDPLRRWDRP
jgi:hypothetical protein